MRKITKKLAFFLSFLLFGRVQTFEPSQCIAPLGMESGLIKDADISASSSFDHKNVGPRHGRIRNDINGGAWCPKEQASVDTPEWLEIDLQRVHTITATEIQGRFGNGQGVEFAEEYVLEYFRPSLKKWVRYRTKSNNHLLKGNVNTYTAIKTILDPPIWASKIRFLPYSSYKRTVCMRVEIYGCSWTEGILSYSMPQGDKRSTAWEFYDFSYDGHWDGNVLKYGLGQLVDGQNAPDDFKVSFNHESTTQNWIGWRGDVRNFEPIEIIFEFERMRQFRAVHIYVNNQFTKDIQMFCVAKIFFSSDNNKSYKQDPIIFENESDRIFENGRDVTVKLRNRIGKFVKIQLHFTLRWILISEIRFESILFNDEELLPPQQAAADNSMVAAAEENNNNNNNSINEENNENNFGAYLGIASALFIILTLSIIIIVMYVIVQQQKIRKRTAKDVLGIHSLDLVNIERNEAEYAVPLQEGYTSPDDRINKSYDEMSSSDQYYAAVEFNKPDFIPPPPPCSPRPLRLINNNLKSIQENIYVNH